MQRTCAHICCKARLEKLFISGREGDKLPLCRSVYFRDIDHDNKKAEYGIFIGEADAAGRGIGSETARLAADYARDVLKLHKLMLRVFADNVGAVKSYQNAGFVQEACLKDEFLQNGVYRDMLLMAILFEENR